MKSSDTMKDTRQSYCIICGKNKEGVGIKEDYVIGSIRWFNRKVLKQFRNNRLVVCKTCYPKYKEQRKKFVGRQRLYIALGAIFLILGVLLDRTVAAFLLGIAVVIVLYLFSLLSYVPELLYKHEDGKAKAGKEAA